MQFLIRGPRQFALEVAGGSILALMICLFRNPAEAAESDWPVQVEVQHPYAGAIMPRNMPAPVVLWKTNVAGIARWSADFGSGQRHWSFDGIQPMWRPAEADWRQIKGATTNSVIELTVSGYGEGDPKTAKATGTVRFTVSREAVESPLFYRDVNLPFLEAVKDPSKIRWRFGTIDTGVPPPVVLENLPVCGNCHSFSRNGGLLAMDVDYANNKGSYVIARTAPEMKLATSDIITWDDYRREDGQETLGLLSQISPAGRYVLSTVKDLSVFMPKPDLAFSQLFFPFMGIIGVYDREAKRFFSLPGADDPAFVQSNPTWSPDGKWVVFARNRAVNLKKAREKGRVMLTREDDEELFRQTREYRYDLYRLPFNDGKGGKAEPLRGASANGKSNYFPKYSPDGHWIVFCQASNYMLLQPDSEMFIIPAEGGNPRRLACNLSRMNSWHSWTPDSHWLVFTSKEHSDYTQLYLSRISDQGESSPPVWLAHMVEPKRVANIPEFVDLPANGIVKIDQHFLDDYSWIRSGNEFLRAGEIEHAVERYQAALKLNPDNANAHQRLALLLDRTDKKQAIVHMREAVRLNPHDPITRFVLGCSLASSGDLTNAIAHFEEGVRRLLPSDVQQYEAVDRQHRLPEAIHYKLALAYQQTGRFSDAELQYREALKLSSDYPEVQQNLGMLMLRSGRLDEAADHLVAALKLMPESASAHNCLGIVRQRQGRKAEALDCYQKAVACDPNDWQAHLNLAFAYLNDAKPEQAIPELKATLRINPGCKPAEQALAKVLSETGSN
jgi:tetratricopeptide (TPR) repeat protein